MVQFCIMSLSLPPIPNILRATLPGLTRFCNTRISQLVVLDYPGYQWFFSRTTRSFAADISCFVPKYGRNFDPLELDRLALIIYYEYVTLIIMLLVPFSGNNRKYGCVRTSTGSDLFACLPAGGGGGGVGYFSYILLHEIQTMFSQLAKQSARILPADRSSP